MGEQQHSISNEKLTGKYTDFDVLSDKINRQINSGIIEVDKFPLPPLACLNWDLTYEIYDCLFVNGPLTPAQIASQIDYEKPLYDKEVVINHTLERMSDIGITRPVNHENLTSGDLPFRGDSISPILYKVKKWELTDYIKM